MILDSTLEQNRSISFPKCSFVVVRTRVIMRYVGSGIRRVGSGITGLASGITSRGIEIDSFFEGSGIRLYHFCWIRGQNLCHAFVIKDQKFGYK